MNEMIDRQKLLRREDVDGSREMTTEQRQDNRFLESMEELRSFQDSMQESRFSWRSDGRDSQSMMDVKAALNQIVSFMNTDMAADQTAFETQLLTLTGIYQNAEEKCRAYLDSHKHTLTKSGRARKNLVKRMLNSVQRDQQILKQKAFDIHRAAAATGTEEAITPLWVNVLGAIRTVQVDLRESQVGETGGATSDVAVLNLQGTTYFYKEDEQLRRPMEEVDRAFPEQSSDREVSRIIRTLKGILTENVHDPVTKLFVSKEVIEMFSSEDPASWAEASLSFARDLAEMGETEKAEALNWGDPKVIQTLHKLLPDYSKWLTRFGAATEAKIDTGRLLTDRNIATSRVAALLGMEDIVAPSSKVVVEDHGKLKSGIAMKQARGASLEKLRDDGKNDVIFTPEAARKLSMLQLFDILCGQVDRNGTNIFYTAELIEAPGEKPVYKVTDVQGIDNDMAFGKLLWTDVTRYRDGILKMVAPEHEGRGNFPAIDEDMAAALDALQPEQIRFALKDLLNDEELGALENRLTGIKDLLNRNRDLVKPKEQWDHKTLSDMLKDGAQPLNAYMHVEPAYTEEKYMAAHEKVQICDRIRTQVDRDLKDAPLEEKVKCFVRYFGNLTLVGGRENPNALILEDVVLKALDGTMSSAFLDAMAAVRWTLAGNLIERYQTLKTQPIPREMLKPGDDGTSVEAKEEYARMMLKNEEDISTLERFNLLLTVLTTMVDFEEEGTAISPGVYIVEKIHERDDEKICGLTVTEVDEILTSVSKEPDKYRHIRPEIVQRTNERKTEIEDEAARTMMTGFVN